MINKFNIYNQTEEIRNVISNTNLDATSYNIIVGACIGLPTLTFLFIIYIKLQNHRRLHEGDNINVSGVMQNLNSLRTADNQLPLEPYNRTLNFSNSPINTNFSSSIHLVNEYTQTGNGESVISRELNRSRSIQTINRSNVEINSNSHSGSGISELEYIDTATTNLQSSTSHSRNTSSDLSTSGSEQGANLYTNHSSSISNQNEIENNSTQHTQTPLNIQTNNLKPNEIEPTKSSPSVEAIQTSNNDRLFRANSFPSLHQNPNENLSLTKDKTILQTFQISKSQSEPNLSRGNTGTTINQNLSRRYSLNDLENYKQNNSEVKIDSLFSIAKDILLDP